MECWVADPDVNGFSTFSHDLLAVLVHHSEMRNVSLKIVIRLVTNINSKIFCAVLALNSWNCYS